MCADGFENFFWPGMIVEQWAGPGDNPEPGYDVVYSSWSWNVSSMSYCEMLGFWRAMLRVDGLLKVIVPKGYGPGLVERLLGAKFEIRETMETPFKGGSFEVEAVKR